MSRRRSIETRAAILDAARLAFAVHGYDQVGVREITATVGVNPALVNRYFGTKELLFAEAIHVPLGFDSITETTAEGLCGILATFALDKTMDRDEFDPLLALLRSAPTSATQPILRAFLTREAIDPLAARIGGGCASERASLIVAFLLGIVILRTVIKSDPLASTRRNDLALLIERIIGVAAGHFC